MAFPQDRTPLRVELAFGANLTAPESTWQWTEVSGDLLNQQITITRGRADESAQASPTSVTFELDNPTGAYTPGHPLSQHYPNVQLGTPCRVFGDGGESYLRLAGTLGSYARTPDAAALDITGDIDLRVEATADWYSDGSQGLLGKWNSATGQRSYLLRLLEGYVIFNWSENGTVTRSALEPLPTLPRRAALRVTLDVDNGAGGNTVQFYWSDQIAGPWTPIGTSVISAPITSIHSGTEPLEIGPTAAATVGPPRATLHRAEVRNGIGGTLVADVDVRSLAPGTTAWSDPAGRHWTLGPDAEVSDRQYRMAGTIDDLRPTWPYGDLSTDTSPGEARVDVTVSGALRRLGQGQKALDSTLRRRIPAATGLLAYWPMEEGDAATTQAFSPVEGVQPLTLIGAEWASADTLAGSAPLPTVRNPTTLSAPVPAAATTGWQIEWVYNLPTLPAAQTEILRIGVTGATMRWVIVYASTAAIRIETRDADFVQLAAFSLTVPAAIAAFAGKWNRLAVYTGDAGGGVTQVQATWRDVTTGLWYYVGTTPTSGQGRVGEVSATWGAAVEGLSIGHLAAFSTPGNGVIGVAPTTQIFEGADDGFFGETAGRRFQRLCDEEGVPAILRGPATDTVRMGPQRPATLLSLLQECAAADGGILTDQRDATGLEYRPRTTLYNQPTALALNAQNNEIINPFAPVLDDKDLRNDVTVSRPGGSSARVEADASIASAGRYDEQITVNVATDEQLEPTAAWRVHLGTWPGMRYPAVVTELSIAPQLVEAWLQMDVGDRCQVTGLPPQHPTDTVDSLMQGYTETISPTRWTVSTTCSPAGPWTVGVVEDPVLGRADTDGTELSDAVSDTTTTWPVTVTAGPAWITTATHPAMFPFDVTAGGEQVTVTAVTGAGPTQTMTVVRSVNGIVKAHASGTRLSLTHPMRAAL
ncbi:hypothetical protein [Streptomyces bacillaris]|uniref:hypothetical protein n=1 Tax=Streptomyces bacillaris TaxID=68179 RepID=UPI00345FAEA7